jgi:hypothetical protein
MKTVKVFLASSDELAQDRRNFGYMVDELNAHYSKLGVHIDLLMWERFDAAYNGRRKQDEYNEQIGNCDIFIALFHTRAGMYSLEEVDCALDNFKKSGTPKIYFYMKNLAPDEEETEELKKFKQDYLQSLHHFPCRYDTYEGMKSTFMQQVEEYIFADAPELFKEEDDQSEKENEIKPTPTEEPEVRPTYEPPVTPPSSQCPKTWLVESILVTIACCLPFGIAGIVFATKVTSYYTKGLYKEATEASSNAAKYTKIGFIVGIVLDIIYIIVAVCSENS